MVFEKFKKALKEFIGTDKQRETAVAHQYVQWDEEGGLHVDSRIMNTVGMRRQLESAAMLAKLQRKEPSSLLKDNTMKSNPQSQEKPSPVLKGNAMRSKPSREAEPSPVLKGDAMRLYRQRDQKDPPQDPKKNLKR